MLLIRVNEWLRYLLRLHLEVFILFQRFAYSFRPNDNRLNYYRALFFVSVVDMFFGLNLIFTISNALKLNLNLDIPLVIGLALFVVVLNAVMPKGPLDIQESKNENSSGDAPRAMRLWVVTYIAIQIPWLFLNRSWHLMR